jgi:PKD repeat protein
MMKQKVIPLVLLFILVLVFLVAPVAAAGLTVTDGVKINATDGATSPVITITDADIAQNGTITIDVMYLTYFIASNTFTPDNVIINDTAAAANWTVDVAGTTLTLTSTGGATAVGETVSVTFTGATGNPWVADTMGEQVFPLTATRTDGLGDATFNFVIETVPPPQKGLTIADGSKITAALGATSPVITITESPLVQDGKITINVLNLHQYIASFAFTTDNIAVNDTAANATWTGTVAGNILTLTSIGGATVVGETVTVTFTGAGGNPWFDNSGGEYVVPLTATRTDGLGQGYFNFVINTVPLGGLTVTDGAKITTTDGATSPAITITNELIAQDGTITINVTGLNGYVANGTFITDNVVIDDSAVVANWTGTVADDTLTLTSAGGTTAKDETVMVTFTGAINPWVADSGGEKTAGLTATRTDTSQTGTFDFVISTGGPVADFSASRTSDIAPLTVTFTDTSTGSPTSWNWSFGDGSTSPSQNPSYTYTNAGEYTVSLNATYAGYGTKTKTQFNYITVLNGAIRKANTSIKGLTITNCGGPQIITVDTSILPAALFPNNSVLEIQPPADRGFKKIIMNAPNGVGFSREGNLITGNPTGVHLITEEIAPSLGFSSDIGTNASFNYSIDLSSYPCNAILSTKIWEGVISEYDNKFRWIASNNSAFPVGTAYTANIIKTNFPSDAHVKVHMSVNSSWSPSIFGDYVFIWRIADDGNSGQILPTTYLYSDPVNNLDYFEADSPLGLSTFGISSLTGNNNPFQIVAFVVTSIISASNNPGPASWASGGGGKAVVVPTMTAPETKQATPTDPGKTAKIYANAEGTITQATTLQSTDGLANVSLGLGIVARNSSGMPLTSISITRIADLPAAPPGDGLSFAGMAYEIKPDGATFSPAIPLSFTIPQGQWGQEYVLQAYDHETGTWQALPCSFNPETGIITTEIAHLCCFALFAKSTELPKAVTPEPTIIIASKSSISTNVEMYGWIFAMIVQNPVIIVIVLAALAVVAYFGWYKRRL